MGNQSVEVLIEGGKATAAPPLGPALGPMGVNIGQVVSEINKKTAEFKGMKVPVKVIVDSSTKAFEIKVGTPPASALIRKEAGIEKGSGNPLVDKVADLRIEHIIKIAKMKSDNLTGKDLKAKVKEIIGTCNSMGVMVEGVSGKEALRMLEEGRFDKKIKEEKTELTAEEIKKIEEERRILRERLTKKHAEEEAKAAKILEEAKAAGKDDSAIRKALREAGISEETIHKVAPVAKASSGAPGKGK